MKEPENNSRVPAAGLTRRSILCSFGALGLSACGGGGIEGQDSESAQETRRRALATATQSVNAGDASIGINLRDFAAYGMASTDLAGAGGSRNGFWNNLTCPSYDNEAAQNSGVLVDNIGAPVVGLQVTVTSHAASGVLFGPDQVTVPPLTNDANLFASVLDQRDTGASAMSITGIPYATYDLYVYVRDDGSTRAGTITANGVALQIRGGAGIPTANGSGYVEWNWPNTTAPANYAFFRGLSGDVTASVVATSISSTDVPRIKVAGFQIVRQGAIPAPTAAPSVVSATVSAGNQEGRVSWIAVPTATSYKVYRNGSLLATVSAAIFSYSDAAVNNGASYAYSVSAVNSFGEGPRSTAVSVVPAAPAFSQTAVVNAVYQYSIPVTSIFSTAASRPADPMRRAYLWVPPSAARINGVIFGIHNMLEKPLLEDPAVRQACTAAGLGIVMISPGDAKVWTPLGIANYVAGLPTTAINLDPNEYTPPETNPATGSRFANASEQAGAEVAVILQRLATESGFSELAFAPILLVGHSAASNFLWARTVHTSAALASRVFAIISYKGFYPGGIPAGLPILHVSSEWQEISDWGNTWEVGDAQQLRALRSANAQNLIGECVQPGTGHFHYSDTQSAPIAAFIQAVANARIPANWPKTSTPTLQGIAASAGWLVGVTSMNSGNLAPVTYASWTSSGKDPSQAFWYPDQNTAAAVCTNINKGFQRQAQMINVYQNPTTLTNLMSGVNNGAGWVPWIGQLNSDGATFQLRAVGLNASPNPRLQHAGPLGIGQGPIQFKTNGSGALRQTSADTFRIWMDRGSVIRAGQPWEPFVIAWHPGDTSFREADRPVQITTAVTVNLNSFAGGSTQAISFASIPNQSADALASITLSASSSAGSGYPVQFWTVSGPYHCDNNSNQTLVPSDLPSSATYPMRVVVAAWQWGRPQVMQSAAPVFNTFWVFKTQAQLKAWQAAGSPVTSAGMPIVS